MVLESWPLFGIALFLCKELGQFGRIVKYTNNASKNFPFVPEISKSLIGELKVIAKFKLSEEHEEFLQVLEEMMRLFGDSPFEYPTERLKNIYLKCLINTNQMEETEKFESTIVQVFGENSEKWALVAIIWSSYNFCF